MPESACPAARIRRHPAHAGTVSAGACAPNATARLRSTCPGTARPPRRRGRSRSRAASRTCSVSAPRALRALRLLAGRARRAARRARRARASRAAGAVSSTAGIDDATERARAQARRRVAWPSEFEAGPIEEFMRALARPAGVRRGPAEVARGVARADQLRNRPAASRRSLRGIGTGEMQPLWSRLGELRMPVTVLVGERDAQVPCARRAHGRAARDAELRSCLAARLHSEAACRALAECDDPRERRRACDQPSTTALHSDPGRLRRHGDLAACARQRILGPSNIPSVARPQAGSGPREASAAAACTRGRDPERAVERRGQVYLRAGGSHERGRGEQAGDASAARDLQADRVGHARAERAVLGAVSSIATRTATRSRTSRTALQTVHGLLDQLQPGGRERVDRCAPPPPRSTRRSRPRAAPPAGPAAARTAARRPASSPMPTFTFRQSKPCCTACAACSAAPGAIERARSSR